MWSGVWGYRESISITGGLFLTGIALGYALKREVTAVQWPANLFFGLFFILIIGFSAVFFRKSDTFRWLSGKKNAICAIAWYLIVITLLGFVPQKTEPSEDLLYRLGFSHILSSHYFLFAQVYLLMSLGMVTARRMNKLSVRNLAFLINHFGLWLTLFAIGLGAGDLQRVRMIINKEYPVYEGYDEHQEATGDLGLAIQLLDFSIDFYPPKAYIIEGSSGEVLEHDTYLSLKEGEYGEINGWKIHTKKYLEYALGMEEQYFPVYETGAMPAAYVVAESLDGSIISEGWISCGSYRFHGRYLELTKGQLLAMAQPEAKSYRSEIKIYTQEGDIFDAGLSVGKPVSVNGWKIYQTSYDTERGRWSEISIVELVKDPWISVVYAGMIMMVLGAFYLIITGKRKQE